MSQESSGEAAAIQPKFPTEGLVLLAGNTTIDSGDKEDGRVNKEFLRYDFSCGEFPLKPTSQDSSWSREIWVLSQARMAAYTSDSPVVHALQCGFHQAWLQALDLKKNMSLISNDMSQPIQLDNTPGHLITYSLMMMNSDTYHVTCHLLLKGCGKSSLIGEGWKTSLTQKIQVWWWQVQNKLDKTKIWHVLLSTSSQGVQLASRNLVDNSGWLTI